MGPPRQVRLFYHVSAEPSTWGGPRHGPHTPNVRAAPTKPGPPSSTVSRLHGAGDETEPVALIAVAGAALEAVVIAGDRDGGALDRENVEAEDEGQAGVAVGGAALEPKKVRNVPFETAVVGDADGL